MFNFLKKKKLDSSDALERVKIKISGLHCVSCGLNIDGDLEELEGVREASTNYAQSITNVTYDPSLVTLQKIKESIKQTGYEIDESA